MSTKHTQRVWLAAKDGEILPTVYKLPKPTIEPSDPDAWIPVNVTWTDDDGER